MGTDQDAEALRALGEALRPFVTSFDPVGWARRGWTAAVVRTVSPLAERWAGDRLLPETCFLLLGTHWDTLTRPTGRGGYGLPHGLAMAWLAVLAGTPGPAEATKTQSLFAGILPGDEEAGPVFARWCALGDHGPVAWAAGLGIEEAEARAAVGTLRAADLPMLAGLRGYRLPEGGPPGGGAAAVVEG